MSGPVRVDDSELQDLLRDIEDAIEKAKTHLQPQMRKATLVVEAEAKIRSSGRPGPNVITGAHRAGITSEARMAGDDVEGAIGGTRKYSPFLEYGTSKMPAYPWLRPAVEAKTTEIERLLGQVLDRIVERIVE